MRKCPILFAFVIFFSVFCNAKIAVGEVLMLGDSIFKWRGDGVKRGVEQELGEEIYSLAVSGAKSKEIADQYYKLIKSEVKFELIMDGGGNDILSKPEDCRGELKRGCYELLAEIADSFARLFDEMAKDEQVRVYYVVPHYPQGISRGFEAAVDLGTQVMKSVCMSAPLECHLIDVRADMVGPVLDWDGIHPNQKGIKILSEKISEAIKIARQTEE